MPRRPFGKWNLFPRSPREEAVLAARLGLHPLAAAALRASGVTSPAEAAAYLSGSLADLPSPFGIADMEKAVDVVAEAVRGRAPILVHGDYDADGVCSTAVLLKALATLGAEAAYFIPHRLRDGYGVSAAAIEEAADEGIRYVLVLTTDCGIAAHDEIALVKSRGCKVIVLDHHLPGPELPPADAVVAPRLPGWEYSSPDMPASALALRFVQALAETLGGDGLAAAERFADIAAVGTIADVAPMTGENRVIARAGLNRLPHTPWPGLRALREVAGLADGDHVRAWDVAFRIAPRINAAGRLADATDALELLLTDDETQARRLALYLDNKNRERQRLQKEIFHQALEMVATDPELLSYPILVLSSPEWHVGVVGVVASKLVEEFGRPAILLVEEDGVARGSARSVEGFDITAALAACSDLLLSFGGHAMAAGMRLRAADVDRFRDCLADQAEARGFEPARETPPPTAIPAQLEELDETLPEDLARLEPFGPGNPEPLFAIHGLEVIEARTVGRDGQHLKLFLTDGRKTLEAIGFGMAEASVVCSTGDRLDVCGVPELDDFWGPPQVQLRIEGLRAAHR